MKKALTSAAWFLGVLLMLALVGAAAIAALFHVCGPKCGGS